MPQKKKTITVDMDKVQPITVSAADVSPISSQPDPQAELKQRYGLPPSADLSKPFFDPANKSVKDAIAFSKAYAELNPPAPPKEGFFPSAGAEAKGLLSGMFSHPSPAVGAEWAQGVADNPINALPIVGPMLTARAKQAKTDVPGAIGAGLIDIAALGSPLLFNKNLRGKVTGAPAAAREAIGARLYTPAGEMKPTPKMAAQVGGGLAGTAAGAAVAHPYIGAAAGYKMGPALLERAFPEPAVAGAARETFAQTKMITEAQEAAVKQNAAVDRLAVKKAAGEGPEPLKPYRPLGKNVDLYRSTKTAEASVPKGPSHVGAPKPIPAREVVPVTPASELPVYEGPYKPGPSARLNRSVSSSAPVGKSYENRGLLRSRPSGTAPSRTTATGGNEGLLGDRPSLSEQASSNLIRQTILSPADAANLQRQYGNGWKMRAGEGTREYNARLQGMLRAGRNARGMREPE